MKYREVKRKAEVGEKIKIVNKSTIEGSSYDNEDILTVKSTFLTYVGIDDLCIGVTHEEYVVLEPIKKFDWEEFKASNKTVVHCKTEAEAKDFCKRMHKHGLKWKTKEPYGDDTKWRNSEECYSSDGYHSSIEYYKIDGHEIIEYSDYFKPSKKQVLKDRIAELEREVEKLKFANDCLVKNNSELSGKVNELTSKNNKIDKENERLNELLDDVENIIEVRKAEQYED